MVHNYVLISSILCSSSLDQTHPHHMVESSSFQQPQTDVNVASGCPQFVKHDDKNFVKHDDKNFVKDDTIFIKYIVDVSSLMQPTGESNSQADSASITSDFPLSTELDASDVIPDGYDAETSYDDYAESIEDDRFAENIDGGCLDTHFNAESIENDLSAETTDGISYCNGIEVTDDSVSGYTPYAESIDVDSEDDDDGGYEADDEQDSTSDSGSDASSEENTHPRARGG